MKKELISLGMAIALLLSAAIVRAQDEAQAPSFKNGDFWQFKGYSFKQGRREFVEFVR